MSGTLLCLLLGAAGLGGDFHYHTRHIPAEHLRLHTRAGRICLYTNKLCAVTQPENLAALKAQRVDTVELRLTWEEIEREKGVFDFSRFDREVRRVESAGLDVGLMAWFNYAPKWYRGTVFGCAEHECDGGTLSPWDPETLRQVDRLYGEVAKRYGTRIGYVYVTGSGDFGEPVCPQGVDYYKFNPPHTHGGIAWTGDPYARTAWAKVSPLPVEKVLGGEADDATCRAYARFVAEATATYMAEVYRIARRHFPKARFGVPLGHFADFPHGQWRTLVVRKMCAVSPDFTARWSGMGFVKGFANGNVPARRISSAAHFYGCRFGEEAAWYIDRDLAPTALYETIANGSTMLHNDFGNILKADDEVNRMMRTPLYDPPTTEVALLWPDDEEARLAGKDPSDCRAASAFVADMRKAAARIRATTDYAICDSTMVADGFLRSCGVKRLVLLDGRIPPELSAEIAAFRANDGEVVSAETYPAPPAKPVYRTIHRRHVTTFDPSTGQINVRLKSSTAGAECGQVRIAEGGKPLAKIVIAKDADKAVCFAALDLKWHLDRMTGGSFEIIECSNNRIEELKKEGKHPIFVGPSGCTKTKVASLGRQQYVVDVQKDAIELVGFDKKDKGKLVYTNTEADGVGGKGWPDLFDEQGTMYAVYEFLENHCGVRWLDSTDYGTILPKDPNLSVACGSSRKEPFIRYRGGTGCEGRPDYSPTLLKGMGKSKKSPELERYEAIAYRHAKGAKLQRRLFLMRHRAGGDKAEANHSFYFYYRRFWDKDAKEFESFRPEIFAKGYPGKPPQMCYTSDAFVEQVVKDARDYFDRGGYQKGKYRELGAKWGKNAFCLEPMDNTSYCLCDGCRALTDDGPDVPRKKRQSRLWFTFVNRVAREIRKSHPDKWITTLAYADHECVPDGVTLEDNVIVYFCILWNRMPYRDGYPEQLERLRQWRAAYPDQPMALWLYNTFPLEIANKGKWHCFPGYFAHTAESQYRLFKELNVRHGIFHCGFDNEMENYMQLEWMQNPDRTADEMLDEYFSMYGKAAKPLRAYYDLVERRYCDKSLYPKGATHETMQIAWGSLGDVPTMAKLGALMDEATALAETEDEKRRVELFRIGVWDYMKSGFDTYCLRQATPMPMWTARVVPSAEGDPDKVDWAKLPVYDMPTYTRGTTNRHETVRERIRFAHDGKFLYLEAEENADPAKLIISPKIVPVDDWELLFAGQRGQPFRYYTSGPDARMLGSSFGEVNWRQFVPAEESGHPAYGAVCRTDRTQRDRWTSRWAFPLDKMLDRPVKPGDTIFFNGLRVASKAICGTAMNAGGFDVLSLVSFTSVRTPDRLGSLALERPADRADETARWQQAIDAALARGGGEVRVGRGEHAVGCLQLKDNVTLVLEEGARLVSLPGISAFPREDGPAVVWATNAQHVAIRGKGTIDGRGADFPQVCTFNERPRLVRFDDCRDVTVEGVRLVNPARWTLFLNRCDGFAVRGVKIRAHANFNNDGIDIASKNGIVEDCDVDSYDDGIVFKALTPDTVVANVKVRNCRVSSNCAAIKFGTETFGAFRDIEISDCRVEVGADCPRWEWAKDVPDTTGEHPLCKGGLAIEMVDGGTMERITARNVSFKYVETPVFVRLNARRVQATPSKLEDVVLENLTGEAASGIACHITGIPGLRVKNVKVKDVRFSVPGGHSPAEASLPVPEREQGHPDSRMFGRRLLPAHGFYVRHADNVTFENVVFDCRKPDTRPAIVREDVK